MTYIQRYTTLKHTYQTAWLLSRGLLVGGISLAIVGGLGTWGKHPGWKLAIALPSLACLAATYPTRRVELEAARELGIFDDAKWTGIELTAKLEMAPPTMAELQQTVLQPSAPELVSLKTFIQRQVSFLIFGNSGSGKTSTALHLIGELTSDRPCQGLVLDPHLNDWGAMPVISGMPNIIRQLDATVKLLQARQDDWTNQCKTLPPQQRKKNWDWFILVWDEIGAALNYAKSPEGKELIKREELIHPSSALLRLGSELRKFNGFFIGLNQSGNCLALGIDSNYRSNFIDIHLCESALKQAEEWTARDPGNNKLPNAKRQYIEAKKQGYPCVIMDEPSLHPTHAHHQVFAEGNTPSNIRPVQLLPLKLKTVVEPIIYSQTPQIFNLPSSPDLTSSPDPSPTSPNVVRKLEALLNLEYEPPSPDPSPDLTSSPDLTKFNVFAPDISDEVRSEVLKLNAQGMSQVDIIKKVWGAAKTNKSKKYCAAKRKYRRILADADRPLGRVPYGQDPDDNLGLLENL